MINLKKIFYYLRAVKVFFTHYFLLKKLDTLSREEKEKIKFNKLKELINLSWSKIPFYRKYWSENGFNPSDFQSIEDFSKIPFIDKDIVRSNLDDLLNVDYPKDALTLVKTGGTTGMPMGFYLDNYKARAKELAYLLYNYKHFFSYRYFIDEVAVFRGAELDSSLIESEIYWMKSKKERGLIYSSFHLTADTYPIYIKQLRRQKPKFIVAYPSSIVSLASLMYSSGDFRLEGLKGVICSSENVYDEHRDLIRKVLGVEIYSFYGHCEKSVAAYQNLDGFMKFQELYGYTEFLSEDLKPIIENETASQVQVVVTSFDNHYFPFIRYKTDDYVELESKDDSLVKKIIGRKQEFLYDKSGNKIPFTCSDEVFWASKGVDAYQYVQKEYGKIILKLQVNAYYSMEEETKIMDSLQKMFVNFEFELLYTSKIERTKSGKFRYLIQEITV